MLVAFTPSLTRLSDEQQQRITSALQDTRGLLWTRTVPASMRRSHRATKRRAVQQQESDPQKSQRLHYLSSVQQDDARPSLGGTVSVLRLLEHLNGICKRIMRRQPGRPRSNTVDVHGSSSTNIQAAFDALSHHTQTVV